MNFSTITKSDHRKHNFGAKTVHPIPQFTAKLQFHFREHGPESWHCFMFGENLHRRVPMRMDGVEGLNTVGMWVTEPATFRAGETTLVQCVVVAPELFTAIVKPGVQFELWGGGFFASGTVLERNDAGWPPSD